MRKLYSIFIILLLSGLFANGQSALDHKVAKAIATMECAVPTERDPVTLKATLVSDGDSSAVIVKVVMAPEWHIYQYVPPNSPYVQLENMLSLPKGLVTVGKWQFSEPIRYVNDHTVLIHEEKAWFVQKIVGRVEKGSIINTGLYYQTCDHRQCLPPVEVKLAVKTD